MKKVLVIILVMLWSACSRSPVSEEKLDDTTSMNTGVDSSVYVEQRMRLADKLSQLIDSIDSVTETIRRDSSAMKGLQYQSMMDNLRITKDRVEQDLLEVNTTALNGWDEDYVNRIELNTDKNRRELDNILGQLNKGK
jgi:hypothetical protein